jgi:hypothetical protein
MSVPIDENYKNKIASSIIVDLNKAILSGDLPDNEIHEVCTYVTVVLRDMKTDEELVDFYKKMRRRWPFFSNLLDEMNRQNKVVGQLEDSLLKRNTNVNITRQI